MREKTKEQKLEKRAHESKCQKEGRSFDHRFVAIDRSIDRFKLQQQQQTQQNKGNQQLESTLTANRAKRLYSCTFSQDHRQDRAST